MDRGRRIGLAFWPATVMWGEELSAPPRCRGMNRIEPNASSAEEAAGPCSADLDVCGSQMAIAARRRPDAAERERRKIPKRNHCAGERESRRLNPGRTSLRNSMVGRIRGDYSVLRRDSNFGKSDLFL